MPDLFSLTSPILIKGDASHAYRDPAVLFHDGILHLYMTLVETEPDGVFLYLAESRSPDLLHWTEPRKLTVRDRSKNFSSPGNVVFADGRFLLCLQTYCRENGEKYGNANCRIYFMESEDLQSWSEPCPVPLKGELLLSDIGRMIDPYLLYDESTGLWNCFFKQNGVSRSTSPDLVHWRYEGHFDGGENVSVLKKDGVWFLFHSPRNGIGVKTSPDLVHWTDRGLLTFGQEGWDWARGRLTAGTVLETSDEKGRLYLMFFHGTGPEDESVVFDRDACIGLAWSRDLITWNWPGGSGGQSISVSFENSL